VTKLEARGLSFGYEGTPVGEGVDLGLAGGEIVCLLGPNGGGKTTLFRTLLGVLPPIAGEVWVAGRPLASWSRRERARLLGWVPQAHAGLFAFTVEDVVLMGRTARRGRFAAPSRRDHDAARSALERLGIGRLAARVYTQVSGGERQLTLIARALAQEAGVLILDEPTASLDFGNQTKVLAEVRRLAQRGAGIILSTHDPDHAFAIASRVMLMQDGRLVASGTPADVLTAERLREVYGVPVTVETLASGQRVCAPVLS
jgi:iron complex transport system ATP-binding protein